MISVIIPTYNEAPQIQQTIQKIWLHDHAHLIKEIIIADGKVQMEQLKKAYPKVLQSIGVQQKEEQCK
jgi:hypothetical protein